jgi:hypothetical protein
VIHHGHTFTLLKAERQLGEPAHATAQYFVRCS